MIHSKFLWLAIGRNVLAFAAKAQKLKSTFSSAKGGFSGEKIAAFYRVVEQQKDSKEGPLSLRYMLRVPAYVLLGENSTK